MYETSTKQLAVKRNPSSLGLVVLSAALAFCSNERDDAVHEVEAQADHAKILRGRLILELA